MGRYKTLSKKNQYYLPPAYYRATIHWCLQYKEWCIELETEPDSSKGISYDKDRVQTSGNFDTTSELAMRRVELSKKKSLLEETIREVDESIYKYLLMGLGYGFTVCQLKDRGMPCTPNYYYVRRQKVIFYLSRKI